MGTGTAPALTVWPTKGRLMGSPLAFIRICLKPGKEEKNLKSLKNPTTTPKLAPVLRADGLQGFEQPQIPAASFQQAVYLDGTVSGQIDLTPVLLEHGSSFQDKT